MYLTDDSAFGIKLGIPHACNVDMTCRGGDSLFVYWELHLLSSFSPSRSVHNPRRSAHWRTRWQHWGRIMRDVLAPTPVRSGTCRRTSSLPNTSCCECKSSWPWQRRCIIAGAVLSQYWMWVDFCLWAFSFLTLLHAVHSGFGEKVPADCSLSKHERNPDEEEWAD